MDALISLIQYVHGGKISKYNYVTHLILSNEQASLGDYNYGYNGMISDPSVCLFCTTKHSPYVPDWLVSDWEESEL